MVIRKILGLIMLLTGIVILTSAFAGAYLAGDVLAAVGDSITDTLALASQSLDSARATLGLARDSINDVYGGLDTAVGATASAAQTIDGSRPLIDNVATVTTQQVPEAVEGIQAALPNMIQVAAVIDNTLTTLSSVGIDRDIPLPFGGSIPLKFDLGIDYNPTTSFDDSLRVFEASLTGLPESLRGLEDDLQTTNSNLALLAADLQATSENLTTINTRIGESLPLLDQYTQLVDDLGATVAHIETNLGGRLDLIRTIVIALLIAIGLTQLAPIYLGWELLSGRRDREVYYPAASPAPVNQAPVIETSMQEPSNTAELQQEARSNPAPLSDTEDHGTS